MKAIPLAAAAWLLAATASAQQPAPVPAVRADAQILLGWENLHRPQPASGYGNDWLNAIVYAGAGASWYWNDNLKTQVDVGGSTRGRQYRYETILSAGQLVPLVSRVSVQQQSLTLAQQYQFFHNQWFHPRVGVGIDIARETTRTEYAPIYPFGDATRLPGQSSPPGTAAPSRRFVARPFAETGFKAYMTRRVFFTGDARLMFRGGADEVLFRGGFGIDF
jgi:hypothetical protein